MGQKVYTKDFGMIEVDRSWVVFPKSNEEGAIIRQGGHIAQLANGAFVHVTGLPIHSEDEIKNILCTKDLKEVRDEALEWFRNRGKGENAPLPRIMFDGNGYPLFEDGTPVEKFDDLYNCLKPGPVLTAAITGLNDRLRAEEQGRGVKRETKGPAPTMAASKKKPLAKSKARASKPPAMTSKAAPEAPPAQVTV